LNIKAFQKSIWYKKLKLNILNGTRQLATIIKGDFRNLAMPFLRLKLAMKFQRLKITKHVELQESITYRPQ